MTEESFRDFTVLQPAALVVRCPCGQTLIIDHAMTGAVCPRCEREFRASITMRMRSRRLEPLDIQEVRQFINDVRIFGWDNNAASILLEHLETQLREESGDTDGR
jgi:hypothetical protein